MVVADSKLAFAEGTIEYLSRADGFANYATATAAPSNYTLDRDTYEISGNGTYDPYQHNNDGDQMPTTGKNNGLELMDLRGKDYDDPMWEDLLDEVAVDEMVQLIAYGGFATVEVPSIKKIATLDSDGPAGVNYSVSGLFGMGYCGEILLAQTWNIDLAYKMGDGICQEFEDFGLDGWYAPSMNLHRCAAALPGKENAKGGADNQANQANHHQQHHSYPSHGCNSGNQRSRPGDDCPHRRHGGFRRLFRGSCGGLSHLLGSPYSPIGSLCGGPAHNLGGLYRTLRRLYGPSAGFRHGLPGKSGTLLHRFSGTLYCSHRLLFPMGSRSRFFQRISRMANGVRRPLDAAPSPDVPIHFHGRGTIPAVISTPHRANRPVTMPMALS